MRLDFHLYPHLLVLSYKILYKIFVAIIDYFINVYALCRHVGSREAGQIFGPHVITRPFRFSELATCLVPTDSVCCPNFQRRFCVGGCSIKNM